MAIYSGFSHKKWWFSIVMLVYQRVHHFQHGHGGADSSARNLPALLELLCGLGQGPAAEYVAELLQARRGHPPQNWGDFMGNMNERNCYFMNEMNIIRL